MAFRIQGENFFWGARKIFLNSGEIHYFRIKRGLWAKHLQAAVEAGLKTVSTYVPWAWHEPSEGFFDFEGSGHPERDLAGWLHLCQSLGLTCIVKPGPFILAEFRGAGLPDWFLEKFSPEVKMHNSQGKPVASEGVSLFHPAYLEKVTLWYDQIMPFISRLQISRGGPVIMMQVCNEIGVFSWLARQADYSPMINLRFSNWLKQNYGSIEKLNECWETNYRQFDEVKLPPDGNLPYASPADRSRDYDWHRFWRSCYGDYLRLLAGMARERGITVPLYHNLPGWIYGHGYEFPVNITMYEDLYREKSEIVFGVDHIPEFMSHRNMHDDRIINDITLAMQGNKPLFAAEFQSGSREYHVVTSPREMELFYKASIANGLTGWNYYMFSQGRNPARKGYSGDTFYWFNPLTAQGDKTSAFPLVKKMSKIVGWLEEIIVEAKRKAEVCVLFYPPYYATELERPETGNCALKFVPSAIRRPAYFDGLLKVLQIMNIDYDMADLTKVSADYLNKYRQVWAFATDEMDADSQQLIVDYAAKGGQVVVFPYLPDRELSQRPCNIIRDALGIAPDGFEVVESPLVDVLGYSDIKCANPQSVFSDDSMNGAEVIARTISGAVCGFIKKLGEGSVVHLGTWLGFDTEGHKPVYEALLNLSDAQLRKASSNCPNIAVRQRFAEKGSALLFIGNYFNEEQTGVVQYTHPARGTMVCIPFSGKEITWPALYGVLTPICLELLPDLKLLHATSDVLEIKKSDHKIEITLQGDRDLAGELVFEGKAIELIASAVLDDSALIVNRTGGYAVLNYTHAHKKEMVLTVNFSKWKSAINPD